MPVGTRRKRASKNPWNTFLGDCSVVDEYLSNRPVNKVWFPAHYLNVFLRAVGQPAFVNNPICGAIIFASLFVKEWQVGAGCLLGGSIATVTELLLKIQSIDLTRAGVSTFNGVLVGTVISVLYPAQYDEDRDLKMWMFIVVGSFLSVYLCSAFGNFLGLFKVPYLALPFNIIIVCSMLTLQPHTLEDPGINFGENETRIIWDAANNASSASPSSIAGEVDWTMVGRGILVSMSQVYGVNDITTSTLMNVAVLLASPLLFLTSNFGATLGSLLALTILPASDFQEIYDGVWGYNELLTMASLSCVFFKFNLNSFILGTVATAATTVVHFALRKNMTLQNNIPVFTMPMTLVALVFLLTTDVGGGLARVDEPSYPEKQAGWLRTHKKVPEKDEEDVEADGDKSARARAAEAASEDKM